MQLIFTECFSASVVCQALAHFFYILFCLFIYFMERHTQKEKICQNLVGGDGDCLVGVCQEVFTC